MHFDWLWSHDEINTAYLAHGVVQRSLPKVLSHRPGRILVKAGGDLGVTP